MNKLKFEPVRLEGNALVLIDQRRLPNEFRLVRCRTAREVWQAIRTLTVRGAPAIGIAAGYGMYVGLLERKVKTYAEALRALREIGRYLKSARPTAVNLAWAVDRVIGKVGAASCGRPQSGRGRPGSGQVRGPAPTILVRREAEAIHREDRAICEAIGRHGAKLISSGDTLLTHCNAGGLATSGYGTALAGLFTAKAQGKKFQVYAAETRPLLQGARLTLWELKQYGIPATLICDSAAGSLMRAGKIDTVIVGADRIARNGDTANKIGTYSHAALAQAHGIPFYVAAPSSTFDFAARTGKQIPIEERAPEEITEGFGKRLAPRGSRVYNPAFDVTPHELIAGFITERGILTPPFNPKSL